MSDEQRHVSSDRRRRCRGGRRITDIHTHDEAWITIGQLAAHLRVDDRTVRLKWIDTGSLTAYNFEGIWRIKLSDAIAFVDRNRLGPAQTPAKHA